MALALLLDFGSTFTKMTVVDTQGAALVARAVTPTTVEDISIGLKAGLARLREAGVRESDLRIRLACSSARSEEHTSELQSRENLVCRLLLEKKKNMKIGVS